MLIIPAILESFRTLKDKGMKLTLETNELTPSQVMDLMSLVGGFCFVAFKKDEFRKEEQSLIEGLESGYEDNEKTPSQRLRAVLFVLWKQKNEGYEQFDDFYRFKMNQVVEHFKGKLE